MIITTNNIKETLEIVSKKYKNIAVVFDIDDTLLRPYDGSPIRETLDIFYTVKNLNITPILITARADDPNVVLFTKKQLNNIGIGDVMTFFRPMNEYDIKIYKERARYTIQTVYKRKIVMSIGDKEWDMGKWGGVGILVKS